MTFDPFNGFDPFGGGAGPQQFDFLSYSPSVWLSRTGSDASTWPDISGNDRHATQGTVDNQPVIVAAELNGQQVRRFDGVNDMLSIPAFAQDGDQTIIVVLKTNGIARNTFAINSTPTNDNPEMVLKGNGNLGLYWSGSYKRNAVDLVCSPSWAVLSVKLAGTSYVARVNGVQTASATFSTTRPSANCYIDIGNYRRQLSAQVCDMAEFLLFETALSAPDLQSAERTLGTIFGISVA